MVPGEWNGLQVPGWSPYVSCRSGEDSDLQRAPGTVSLVVDIGRGEPEDNGKDKGRAGELFKSKIHPTHNAPGATTTLRKANSPSRRE